MRIKIFLLFCFFALGLMCLPHHTFAAYNASDVIGQTDEFGNPVFSTTVANNGSSTPNAQGFDYPFGLALDSVDHQLFISDNGNNRILEFDLDSDNNPIDYTADHVFGQPDFESNLANQGGDVSSTTLKSPGAIDYDSSSHFLFVAEEGSQRVLIYDLSAGITNGMPASYVLGQPDFESSQPNQGGAVSSTTLKAPGSVTYDSSHERLFVNDNNNNRVLEFDLSDGITNDMPASYVFGQLDFDSSLANQGGTASSTTLRRPFASTYDSIRDRLFINDDSNNRTLVFDLSEGITNDMPASYVLGQPDFETTNMTTISDREGTLLFGEQLGFDSVGNKLFLGDENDNRILIFELSDGISNYMSATAVLGQDDFTSGSSHDGQTGIYDPETNAVFDSDNHKLFMLDNSNNRVLIYTFVHFTTTSLGSATVGVAYNQTVTSTSSQGTLSYEVSSGSLPGGLSLASSTGVISGTPTTAGTSNFTLKVTDDNGDIGSFTDTKDFSITIAAAVVHHSGGGGGGGRIIVPPPPPTPPPSSPTDCQPGDLFSRASGLQCPTSNQNQEGCQAGFTFSPVTGERCTSVEVVSPPIFTRNLTLGSIGEDVRALQVYLNTHGFPLSALTLSSGGGVVVNGGVSTIINTGAPGSPGNETTYFGSLTASALARFQRANGISPAVGYFGPITRAYIQANF